MTFKHLSENPRQQARAWNIALGVPGFRYADLNRVRRLEALDRAFLESLRGEGSGLASAFETWRGGRAREARGVEAPHGGGPAPGPLRGPPLPRRDRARGALRAGARGPGPLP